MRIFHIATVADWEAARASGRYTTSTRGRTLAEEGFIHASRGDQWQAVRRRWYADVTEPLVLLVVDTTRLSSPVVDEHVPDSEETFPHVYGPIDADAVVQTIPLETHTPDVIGDTVEDMPRAPSVSFSRLFLEEMFRNVLVVCAVLVAAVAGALAGAAIDERWGPITGSLLGLLVGVVVVRRTRRRPGR
ncbi:DUF952 domain-containing protein [Nocardioides plantarum]|uniref:DUF952 domain-containing protein n=1 Tax=Nocardioides plantarum TaxID=29299 RepID=A0ABV5K6V1_9ACTN|nr:DUF952 domain-containing protein [Nocardioides plantarum]